jgi:hypothetical protein
MIKVTLPRIGNYKLLNDHGRVVFLMIELNAPTPTLSDMESALGPLFPLGVQIGSDLNHMNAHALCISMQVAGKPIGDDDARLQPIVRCLEEKFGAVVQFQINGDVDNLTFAVHSGKGGVSINATHDRVAEALGVSYDEMKEAIETLITS